MEVPPRRRRCAMQRLTANAINIGSGSSAYRAGGVSDSFMSAILLKSTEWLINSVSHGAFKSFGRPFSRNLSMTIWRNVASSISDGPEASFWRISWITIANVGVQLADLGIRRDYRLGASASRERCGECWSSQALRRWQRWPHGRRIAPCGSPRNGGRSRCHRCCARMSGSSACGSLCAGRPGLIDVYQLSEARGGH